MTLTSYQKLIFHFRSLYSKIFHPKGESFFIDSAERDKEIIQKTIFNEINIGKPLMVARLGSIECDVCCNVLNTFYRKKSNWNFIRWREQPNFLNPYLLSKFQMNAGFFPADDTIALKRFYELMVADMRECDVLGSWLYNEKDFSKELSNSVKVDREMMTPLLTSNPWTKALENKKVLVVHPFKESIKSQYARREKLFPSCPDILPEFKSLHVIKAVQTLGRESSEFKDWFEALDYMKHEIDKVDYDVCLLGCGAYGFPLAAHIKRQGKQAIHLGGCLQLLFGIKGKRWETDWGYLNIHPYTKTYYNDYWVRPLPSESPAEANNVENGCYW